MRTRKAIGWSAGVVVLVLIGALTSVVLLIDEDNRIPTGPRGGGGGGMPREPAALARAALAKELDSWVGGKNDYAVQPPEVQNAVLNSYTIEAVVPKSDAKPVVAGRQTFVATVELKLAAKSGAEVPYVTRYVLFVDGDSASAFYEALVRQ